jgi:UDP-glucose 4-epimerase
MDVLVTGGAGFIGSHLVDALVARGDDVRILDDFFSGRRENVNAAAELIEGSITDPEAVEEAVRDREVVFHLAAHGAVARSLAAPQASNTANVDGTLGVLTASRTAGVRRVVFASSSSVYGGATIVPTPEDAPLRPRSPYAVSKLAGEWYTRVFGELFPLETVALRYFNVFGPRQRADSTYAAVIPLFTRAVLEGASATVHGDGSQSRDFTYVADVAAANLSAADAPADACNARVFNVAPGTSHTLLDLLETLGTIVGRAPEVVFGPSRPGDVARSQADATAARRDLGWEPRWSFVDGLRETVNWNQSTFA